MFRRVVASLRKLQSLATCGFSEPCSVASGTGTEVLNGSLWQVAALLNSIVEKDRFNQEDD